MIYDIVVIGGGIVGLASAYNIVRRFPGIRIAVIEKEQQPALHQTGHNSGVIHSGIYYKPGSFKAKNCVEGRKALVQFALEHDIPHDICGKVIVATQQEELPRLQAIYERGIANGVENISLIGSEEIREIEPFCSGLKAVRVGCTGIISYVAVAEKLVQLLQQQYNADIYFGQEVRAFHRAKDHSFIVTTSNTIKAKYIVACAGLHCDTIAQKQGAIPGMQIVGFRGDYYKLASSAVHKVKHLIYPVPDPDFPFLGVHFTRMIGGGVECGPNAVFSFKREGYEKTDFSLTDTYQALSYGGVWILFSKHWKAGLEEFKRAHSKELFLRSLQRLIPSLTMADIEPERAGVRAVALLPDGKIDDDFNIVHHENALHVLNAPSPAATASLAIGAEITKRAEEAFFLLK